MNSLNILAIDPAQRTGWAWSDGVRTHKGFLLLGRTRGLDLEEFITAKVDELPTDVLAYEAADFGSRNPHTKAMHSELAGVIKCVADRLGIRCWAFNPGTWKKLALGRGKLPKGEAGKKRVKELLRIHHGIEETDSDIADATGILIAAQQGPPPLTKKKAAKRTAKILKAKQRTLFKVK